MIGTFAGGGFLLPSAAEGSLVVMTNLLLRPLGRRLNQPVLVAGEVETRYIVEVT
jgi:putative Mg2+ transporter-C (MgtC) family protein